jgi:murein DD-endopeptidase MepM/ murein hydrolase activator NlpD
MARKTNFALAVLATVAGGLVVLASRHHRVKTLRPTGAGDLPPMPDILPPPPVAGYEDDEEYVFDPNDPPPSEADYDDRVPCATQEQEDEAMLLGDAAGCILPSAIEPVSKTPVPYAAIPGTAPRWPVRVNRQRDVRVSYQDVRGKWHGRWGRHFGAARKKKDGTGGRYHAGIDLQGDVGDVVVASEAGTVEAILPFTRGTYAIYVRSPDGTLINYGEVERGSWRRFGIESGSSVNEGDSLAIVGAQSGGGAHMLHLEIYGAGATLQQIRQGRMQWPLDADPPPALLDPTRYLLAAQERWIVEHPDIV